MLDTDKTYIIYLRFPYCGDELENHLTLADAVERVKELNDIDMSTDGFNYNRYKIKHYQDGKVFSWYDENGALDKRPDYDYYFIKSRMFGIPVSVSNNNFYAQLITIKINDYYIVSYNKEIDNKIWTILAINGLKLPIKLWNPNFFCKEEPKKKSDYIFETKEFYFWLKKYYHKIKVLTELYKKSEKFTAQPGLYVRHNLLKYLVVQESEVK